MDCPICGSSAVVAKTCVPDLVDQVQQGTDPYDLICRDDNEVECLACGHVFRPTKE